MKWLLLFLPGGSLLLLALCLWRWRGESPVSPSWLVDNDRRSWRSGVDQIGVRKWPINKVVNEHAGFNTQRLRRRSS